MTEELTELGADGSDAGTISDKLSQYRHAADRTPVRYWWL